MARKSASAGLRAEVDRRDVQLQLLIRHESGRAAPSRGRGRAGCVEIEIDPLAPLALRRWTVLSPISIVALLPARFQWIATGRRMSSRACSSAICTCGRRRRRRLLRAGLAQLLADDRVGRADEFGLRRVAVEDEPLHQAAHFRVAFFVAAHVGRRSTRTCPSCRACRAAAGRRASRRSVRLRAER